MAGAPGDPGHYYLCRFLSSDGERGLAAGVLARDPSFALGSFTALHAPALSTGLIEILDERGCTLLTRPWGPVALG